MSCCYLCKFEKYSFDSNNNHWNYLFALPCANGYLCKDCFQLIQDDETIDCNNCNEIHFIPLKLYAIDYMVPKLQRKKKYNLYLMRYPHMSSDIQKTLSTHSMQLRSDTNHNDFALKFNQSKKQEFIQKIKRKGYLKIK